MLTTGRNQNNRLIIAFYWKAGYNKLTGFDIRIGEHKMNVKIGDNIKRLRAERSVTQERLAEYLGVSAQAVSRWESEVFYPDLEALPGIASYFGVTIDSLMGYDASEKEQTEFIMRVGEKRAWLRRTRRGNKGGSRRITAVLQASLCWARFLYRLLSKSCCNHRAAGL